MDGIHFWGDEWNGKSVLEARSLFENGMIQAEIQRKRESDFQYSNREIANNEPPTLLRETQWCWWLCSYMSRFRTNYFAMQNRSDNRRAAGSLMASHTFKTSSSPMMRRPSPISSAPQALSTTTSGRYCSKACSTPL